VGLGHVVVGGGEERGPRTRVEVDVSLDTLPSAALNENESQSSPTTRTVAVAFPAEIVKVSLYSIAVGQRCGDLPNVAPTIQRGKVERSERRECFR
jgi:hypothetical protein